MIETRRGRGWLLLRPLSEACRRRVLPASPCGRPSVPVCALTPSSYRTPVLWDWGPCLVTSSCFNYPLRGPTTKYSPILRYLGLGMQCMNLGGDTVHPLMVSSVILESASESQGALRRAPREAVLGPVAALEAPVSPEAFL